MGYGSPVVLIHGVGLRGAIWAPRVEALRADHDVIAVDSATIVGSVALEPFDLGHESPRRVPGGVARHGC